MGGRPLASTAGARAVVSAEQVYSNEATRRDVTTLGHWGQGNTELTLDKPENLPYMIGLVRQAFETQMGKGDVDLC